MHSHLMHYIGKIRLHLSVLKYTCAAPVCKQGTEIDTNGVYGRHVGHTEIRAGMLGIQKSGQARSAHTCRKNNRGAHACARPAHTLLSATARRSIATGPPASLSTWPGSSDKDSVPHSISIWLRLGVRPASTASMAWHSACMALRLLGHSACVSTLPAWATARVTRGPGHAPGHPHATADLLRGLHCSERVPQPCCWGA